MSALRIGSSAVRIAGLAALVLGVVLWVMPEAAGGLRSIHMLAGVLVTAGLLTLAVLGFRAGVPVLPIVAVVWALVLPIFGMVQGSITVVPHIVVQVAHLAVGLVAIGLGEMLAVKITGPKGTLTPAA
jgi:hypothetical protein